MLEKTENSFWSVKASIYIRKIGLFNLETEIYHVDGTSLKRELQEVAFMNNNSWNFHE